MDGSKPFWRRPEGITGGIFLLGITAGAAMLLYKALPVIINLAQNTLSLAAMLAALGALLFVAFDKRFRNLIWYGYQAVMRWITGLFIQIDPIQILKSYISDIEKSLRNLSKQIGALRGQMRQLKGTMDTNALDIRKNIAISEQGQKSGDEKTMTLSARKAARLSEANAKYQQLYGKMDSLYKVLTRMYENAEMVLEDTRDQVNLKEQEYQAIKTSHSAIQSAISIISGNPDQRAQFDRALETMAEEVSRKAGEMERFMDTSRHLMDTIDLQNGVFEDEGLRMLENMEKGNPLGYSPTPEPTLDISAPPPEILKNDPGTDYKRLFD